MQSINHTTSFCGNWCPPKHLVLQGWSAHGNVWIWLPILGASNFAVLISMPTNVSINEGKELEPFYINYNRPLSDFRQLDLDPRTHI